MFLASYYDLIGKTWGGIFIENLAADIKPEFPDATGYSVRNLKYMAKFAAMFREGEIVQAALAQVSVSILCF